LRCRFKLTVCRRITPRPRPAGANPDQDYFRLI
jgi:hypothetical protein